MYCNYCGNQVKDDAIFCDKCGKSLMQDIGEQESTGSTKEVCKPKKKISTAHIILLVTIVIVVIFCAWVLSDDPIDEAISTVQNGYLGEYTDITVKDILDGTYCSFYESSDWNGGTTDSGDIIVEVKYYDETEKEDGVTIQFTMLDDDCFKITAFVDPNAPIEKSTDLLVKLNCLYIVAYGEEHPEVLYNSQFEYGLIYRLSKISATAALYGASSNYEGNRAEIHKIAGDDMLDVNVVMLLDNYNLLDIYDYVADAPSELQESNSQSNSNMQSSVSDNQEDVESLLYAVLSNAQDFLMTDTDKYVGIFNITNIAGTQFDTPLLPTSFAYVDLDHDGVQEVIVKLTNGVDGWRLILRSQGNQVYGYGFNFRALQSISTDGRIMASSGADNSEVFTLTFDRYDVYKEINSRPDSHTVWKEVDWIDFALVEPHIAG